MSRVIPVVSQVEKAVKYIIRCGNFYLCEVITGRKMWDYTTWVVRKEEALKFDRIATANEYRDFVSGLEGLVLEVEKSSP